MSSLNYTTYVTQLSNLMTYASTDTNFTNFLPGCIDYAEQRSYRDLDLLTTRVINTAGVLSTNSRTTVLSTTTGTFLVVEEYNILTPAGAISSATRNSVQFVSKQFIDQTYPSAVLANGVPIWAAMLSDTTILLGPTPDQPYSAEVIGTIRPQSLSSANSSTFLTAQLPDLLMAASMIFATGFMKNFGGQADNPAMGVSWESQYKTLLVSADTEEARKQYRSQGWTAEQPRAITTPPRV